MPLDQKNGPMQTTERPLAGRADEDLLEPYSHRNLEKPGYIRLLELPAFSPDAGNQQWLPGYRLRHVALSQTPLYTTVSYNCSSEPALSTIKLDGKGFKVRKNGLFMLKLLSRPTQTGTLWIDCICVHQEDIEERNSQARRMGENFGNANFVL